MKVLKETKKHTSLNRCRLLGAHMEGPFLSKSYSGAHDMDSICKPSLSALNEIIKGFENKKVSIITNKIICMVKIINLYIILISIIHF